MGDRLLNEKVAPTELYEHPNWYACLTRARAEKKVERMMEDVGMETFLPLVEVERQWADRKKRVGFPLFPGYVFIRFRLGDIYQVLRTPGVSTILRPNGYPTPVREDELESVRRLVNGVKESGTVPSPVDFLEPGEEVVVVSGPFDGMRGVLIEDRGRTRVAVRITALKQATSVEVARDLVRRATRKPGA